MNLLLTAAQKASSNSVAEKLSDFWGQILVIGILFLAVILVSFFVYLLFYYIVRFITTLLEPTLKSRRKIDIEIHPVVGFLLTFLFVAIVLIILIATNAFPGLTRFVLSLIDVFK